MRASRVPFCGDETQPARSARPRTGTATHRDVKLPGIRTRREGDAPGPFVCRVLINATPPKVNGYYRPTERASLTISGRNRRSAPCCRSFCCLPHTERVLIAKRSRHRGVCTFEG